jgi:hypothetical protein
MIFRPMLRNCVMGSRSDSRGVDVVFFYKTIRNKFQSKKEGTQITRIERILHRLK